MVLDILLTKKNNNEKDNENMKKMMNWMMVAILICGAIMFTSCEDNSDNPVPTKKKYRLVQRKEVYNNSDEYYITDYSYDDQGRLASYVRKGYNTPYSDGAFVDANYTYIYGDHYVIEKHHDNLYFYYTLNDDGLIVQEQRFVTENGVEESRPPYYFQYEDGRMISYEETGTGHWDGYRWEDGDLMFYGQDNLEEGMNKTTFTRSALSVDHGYTKSPLITISEALFLMGYFGKPSKHLESHNKSEKEGGNISFISDDDYTYTIVDGHIVEMVEISTSVMKMGAYESTSTKMTTTTLTYEKY